MKIHRGYGSTMGEVLTVVCGRDAPVKVVTLDDSHVTCVGCLAAMGRREAEAAREARTDWAITTTQEAEVEREREEPAPAADPESEEKSGPGAPEADGEEKPRLFS